MCPSITSVATPKGKVIIRPANLGDLDQFTDLRLEALRDNPTAFGSSYEARENCTPEWALRVLGAAPDQGCSPVAEYDCKLVGMAGIRRSSGVKRQHSATIGSIYIQPAWRGIGILDSLLEVCFEWAKEQQIVILKLVVVTNNISALKAYQRHGFVIYGTEPKVVLHAGVYYDEHLLSKNL